MSLRTVIDAELSALDDVRLFDVHSQALTVTAKTVETHMRHIFQKLDVARRTELPGVLTTG